MNNKFGRLLTFALLVATVLGSTAQALAFFSDVDSATDYREAIQWTVEEGITSGYGNGMWGPDECVRRAELMKMILEYGGYFPEDDYPENVMQAFSDVRKSDWFWEYVMAAKKYGYIEGYSDGTFQPNRCVNRAEAMKIAVNVLIGTGNLDSSGGPVMYDDKIVADITIGEWYGPYARLLFKNRLVGTNHTRAVGTVGGATTINFFPGDSMTRKEVAEMLYRIDKVLASRQ